MVPTSDVKSTTEIVRGESRLVALNLRARALPLAKLVAILGDTQMFLLLVLYPSCLSLKFLPFGAINKSLH